MNKLPILLVDTSYVSFYRLFSTMTWYKFSHPKEDIPEVCHWINNDEYMTKYRLDDDNLWKCDECKQSVRPFKQTRL